ncbi:uncharacterized protein C8A04DRAFT_14915 [Dichotomopilus funicola]|uniref:Heterokaryon incompatibility domain-containing protein n=1 Tax=Dichotomopilus funicola TaxID=1934379 RepID=A0AAN6ZIH7_9PEZI|nr:hypothetical protein C8A04DRAFT_14915 [Dichotomopilus funicola]
MREIQGYELGDCSFLKFHTFPTLHGWTIDPNSHQLEPDNNVEVDQLPIGSLHGKLPHFLQTWLFFGLIYTVVRDDHGPLLNFEDLCDAAGHTIATHTLNDALGQWRAWVRELSEKDYHRAQLHMAQVDFCLNEARMVVRKTCGYTGTANTDESHDIKDLWTGPSAVGGGEVSDELALALMVLGETLSSWTARILHETKTVIRGWHKEEEDDGWGPPRRVFRFMEDRWCPRTIHLLQSQLRSSATLLLSAHQSIRDIAAFKEGSATHQSCSTVGCKIPPGTYKTTHRYTSKCNCRRLTPDMPEILRILARKDANAIPLLVIRKAQDNTFSLVVKDFSEMGPGTKYGAISHVWSDGWGNEDGNWLWSCQIGVIYKALKMGVQKQGEGLNSDTESIPFWMDTLIIPANENDRNARALRTWGIAQIEAVYKNACFTVILDNGLSSVKIKLSEKGDAHCHSAMRILASNWMKRLWTLQEAALSKQLLVLFEESERGDDGILDIDELVAALAKLGGGPASFESIVSRHLADSLMGSTRKRGQLTTNDAAYSLVVDCWRAARWRSTSNEGHEPLALAMLMRLPYTKDDNSHIRNASLKSQATETERDQMVKEFWSLFEREYRGKIPPGLIFLPTAKVKLQGFGWAPRTLMDAYKLDYPDPFTNAPQYATVLDRDKGLKVQYPGIVLHCPPSVDLRQTILGIGWTPPKGPFRFPVDHYKWYAIEPADQALNNNPSGALHKDSTLAIIMTRPNPQNYPSEIALLVEIYDREVQGESTAYRCQVLRRVKICLSVVTPTKADGARSVLSAPVQGITGVQSRRMEPLPCIGEELAMGQEWWVDGFRSARATNTDPQAHKNGVGSSLQQRTTPPLTRNNTEPQSMSQVSHATTAVAESWLGLMGKLFQPSRSVWDQMY